MLQRSHRTERRGRRSLQINFSNQHNWIPWFSYAHLQLQILHYYCICGIIILLCLIFGGCNENSDFKIYPIFAGTLPCGFPARIFRASAVAAAGNGLRQGLLHLLRRFQRSADTVLQSIERRREERSVRLELVHRPRLGLAHLLLVLPVGEPLFLAVGTPPARTCHLRDTLSARAQARCRLADRLLLYTALRPQQGGFPRRSPALCVLGLSDIQHLLQPLSGRNGSVPAYAHSYGGEYQQPPQRLVRADYRCHGSAELLLLHRRGGISDNILPRARAVQRFPRDMEEVLRTAV